MARIPVDQPYSVTTTFGEADSNAKFGRHSGKDFAVPESRGVFAPVSGTVTDYTWSEYHGNVVQIFDGRLYHRLLHNSRLAVTPGQLVVEGQLVAYAGSTGLSTGPHVHYDVATEKFPSYFASFVDPDAATSLERYQRRVGSAGVNYREGPSRSARVIREFPAADVLDFKGWVHGEDVNGNNVWFVGRYSGGYSWSGSFDDPGRHDLDDLNAKPAPAHAPSPAPAVPAPPPEPAVFTADSRLVKEVVPSPNFQRGNIDPTTIIVHQWDDPAKQPTLAGVTAWFLKPDNISPHYVVDDSGIRQFVRETDRAWHAGPNGNGLGIGIEFDPNGGELMYGFGRQLIADIRARRGHLTLTRHSDYMPTRCPDAIDLKRLLEVPAAPTPSSPDLGTLEKRVVGLEAHARHTKKYLVDTFVNYKPE